MGLYQSMYFMSLVGGIAGLIAWAAAVIFTLILPATVHGLLPDIIATASLGALTGGMTVAFADHSSGHRAQARFVLTGVVIGALAGLSASLLQVPVSRHLGANAPVAARILAWMLAGSFIGLGLGLRWLSVNRMRPVHAFAGGLAGGGFGGIIFSGLTGQAPDLSQAAAFVLTGVGIATGVALAPILLRDGLIQFVSSGDARAQSKLGRDKKEWEVQDGDSYVIGSQDQRLDATRYRPEIEIYIPDASIAPRHATLFARDGRFYLARHGDVASPGGQARYLLRVRGQSVKASVELRHADDILVGRTALRFLARSGTAKEPRPA